MVKFYPMTKRYDEIFTQTKKDPPEKDVPLSTDERSCINTTLRVYLNNVNSGIRKKYNRSYFEPLFRLFKGITGIKKF